jgi:hypothetical protein
MISLLYNSIITVFKGKKEETPTENKKRASSPSGASALGCE